MRTAEFPEPGQGSPGRCPSAARCWAALVLQLSGEEGREEEILLLAPCLQLTHAAAHPSSGSLRKPKKRKGRNRKQPKPYNFSSRPNLSTQPHCRREDAFFSCFLKARSEASSVSPTKGASVQLGKGLCKREWIETLPCSYKQTV